MSFVKGLRSCQFWIGGGSEGSRQSMNNHLIKSCFYFSTILSRKNCNYIFNCCWVQWISFSSGKHPTISVFQALRWNTLPLPRSLISSVATKLVRDLNSCVGVQTADSCKYLNKYGIHHTCTMYGTPYLCLMHPAIKCIVSWPTCYTAKKKSDLVKCIAPRVLVTLGTFRSLSFLSQFLCVASFYHSDKVGCYWLFFYAQIQRLASGQCHSNSVITELWMWQ